MASPFNTTDIVLSALSRNAVHASELQRFS